MEAEFEEKTYENYFNNELDTRQCKVLDKLFKFAKCRHFPTRRMGQNNRILRTLHCRVQNKTGKNKGKRSIWFNGKNTKANTEHVKPQFEKYLAKNFTRIVEEDPDEGINERTK